MTKLIYDDQTEMILCGGTGIEFTSALSANAFMTKTSLQELFFTKPSGQSPAKQPAASGADEKSPPTVNTVTIQTKPHLPKFLSTPSKLPNIVFVPTTYSEGLVFHNYKEIFLCGHILKDPVQSLHKVPVYSEIDKSLTIVQVITCRHSLFTLLSNGKLYGLRGNEMSIFYEDNKKIQTNTENKGILYEVPFDKPIKWISNGGGKHFFVITQDHELFAIGDDTFGQLGLGTNSSVRGNQAASNNSNPFKIQDDSRREMKQIDEFESTTFYPKLVKVPLDKIISMQDNQIERVECGLNHTFILLKNTNNGKYTLLSSGCSYYGQTGLGSTRNRNRLSQVEFSYEGEIVDIRCNNNGTYIVTPLSIFYCGINDHNIILKNKAYSSLLTEVSLTNQLAHNDEFRFIECGYNHCVVVTKRNRVFGFGKASANQFGVGINNYLCQEIEGREIMDKEIIAISCGHSHSIIFTKPLLNYINEQNQLAQDVFKLRTSGNMWDIQVFTASKDFSVKIPSYIISTRCPELLKYDKYKSPKSKECLDCLVDWIFFNSFTDALVDIETLIDVLEWMTNNNVDNEYLSTMVLNEAIFKTTEESVYDTIQYILHKEYPKEKGPLFIYWHHALSFCKQYIVDNTFTKIKNSSFLKQNILVEIAKLSDPTILKCKSLKDVKEPMSITDTVASLFDTEETSDVALIIDSSRGFVVNCHKSILDVRCSYFNFHKFGFQAAAIKEVDVSPLFSNWKSRQDITYEDYINFKSLIEYFYTGKLKITTKNALGVMLIWESMNMPEQSDLFSACKDFVARGLTVDNVMHVITCVINRKNLRDKTLSSTDKKKSTTTIQEVIQSYDYSVLEEECLNYCANKWKDILTTYRHDILTHLTKEQLLTITCLQNRVSI